MKQQGATLIEVLVAVLVLSIGLLGIAGLQVISMNYTSSAYQRAQATQLAYDIIDRMRANRTEAEKSGSIYAVSIGDAGSSVDCESATCTSAQMAAYDVYNWKVALAATLPGGDGSVSYNTVTNMVTTTIQWSDAMVQLDSGEQLQSRGNLTFTFRTEL